MIQAVLLFLATVATFWAITENAGFAVAYQIGAGAITLMAAMISLTFLWLWVRRATPLALGMSLSWAGTASVMGWWWVYNILSRPVAMRENDVIFLFLALYIVGAILHFSVIQRSFGKTHGMFIVPVLTSVILSAAIRLVF